MKYAVIDIETTGGNFNEEGITEVAIHLYDGRQVTDSFISLINPEKEIQPFVVQLTGINNKMLHNAPKFHEVAKRIVEITEGSVLVAHNASFDYRVLKNEFGRLGYNFELPTLCTVELSKKLIPEQETYSLGKLCRAIGIPISDRHRANGDAIAALKLFEILLQKDREMEIVKKTIKEGNARDLSDRLLRMLDDIPDESGLIYFHRYNGDILYVGKGQNMKRHVNQIFLRTNKRHLALVKEMQSLTFEVTGSELISRLKYHEEIHIHRPRYNKKRSLSRKNVQFGHENMVLVDRGRSPGEKSVVLIEDNRYRGFGYTDLANQITNTEILRTLVTRTKYHESQNAIIKEYLSRHTVERIIRF
jgi:DNA polymerase-3 subunit epsilon